jgi:hypothetical protein
MGQPATKVTVDDILGMFINDYDIFKQGLLNHKIS